MASPVSYIYRSFYGIYEKGDSAKWIARYPWIVPPQPPTHGIPDHPNQANPTVRSGPKHNVSCIHSGTDDIHKNIIILARGCEPSGVFEEFEERCI